MVILLFMMLWLEWLKIFQLDIRLVDGHGNFGSVDGDCAAAMRYTEARMSKIAMEMLRDIDKDTVDFIPNFDGEEKEPYVLPSRFPNLIGKWIFWYSCWYGYQYTST